jgi:prepilin-type N-terminal cleavage/methylation domain-containing protein
MERQQRGFTLLEILVVLIITSMLVTILLQGLQQIFMVERRLGIEYYRSRDGLMKSEWFRSLINGVRSDYDNGSQRFKGTPTQVSGLSTSGLGSIAGAIVEFELHLKFDPQSGETAMWYGRPDDEQKILGWQGSIGKFKYLAIDGSLHDEWPPFLGKWPQVPSAVVLEMPLGGPLPDLVAAIRGPAKPMMKKIDWETSG